MHTLFQTLIYIYIYIYIHEFHRVCRPCFPQSHRSYPCFKFTPTPPQHVLGGSSLQCSVDVLTAAGTAPAAVWLAPSAYHVVTRSWFHYCCTVAEVDFKQPDPRYRAVKVGSKHMLRVVRYLIYPGGCCYRSPPGDSAQIQVQRERLRAFFVLSLPASTIMNCCPCE